MCRRGARVPQWQASRAAPSSRRIRVRRCGAAARRRADGSAVCPPGARVRRDRRRAAAACRAGRRRGVRFGALRRVRRRPEGRGGATGHQRGGGRAGVRRPRAAAGGGAARPRPGRSRAEHRHLRAAAAHAGHDPQGSTHGGRASRRPAEGGEGLRHPAALPGGRVGPRVELRGVHRRTSHGTGPGDAGFRGPARRPLPQRALRRPAHRGSRAHRPRQAQGLVGRCDGTAAVHALELPPLRRRLRRRRAARHLVVARRRVRVDCQLPEGLRLGRRVHMGPAGAAARRGP